MLIGIVFGTVVFIMGFIDRFYDDVDGFFIFFYRMFLHLFVSVIALIVGCIFAAVIGLYMPKHWEENSFPLASLKEKDVSGVEGNFVLGSGYIESTQYYMWHEKTDVGYIPQKVKVDNNVIICEDSTLVNTGTLIIKTRKMNNQSLSYWLIFDVSTWSDQYKFTIPTGSIKKNFKL